eukprot:jgi/Picsp_1/2390/NSC_05852-R1_mpp10 expressed
MTREKTSQDEVIMHAQDKSSGLSNSEIEPVANTHVSVENDTNSQKLLESIGRDGLEPSESLSSLAKMALQDMLTDSEGLLVSGSTTIYIDGFDAEQIWCQLEGSVKTGLSHARRLLQKAKHIEDLVPVDVEEALDELLKQSSRPDQCFSHDSQDLSSSMEMSDHIEGLRGQVDVEDCIPQRLETNNKLDDMFMKLNEMEAFVQEAEELENFQSNMTTEEEDLDSMSEDEERFGSRRSKQIQSIDLSKDPLATAKYADFFGSKSERTVRFLDDVEKQDFSDNETSEDDHGFDELDDRFEEDQESGDDGDESFGVQEMPNEAVPSAHERNLSKILAKIQRMEEDSVRDKDWYMHGEIAAGNRPKNSALEIDLDFETTIKAPPQATEETTRSIEDLIKKRIIEHRYDDVLGITPPQQERQKTVVELDDVKSTKGLGEIYEDEYIAAKSSGITQDPDSSIREAVKSQFVYLCAKLDQLSHGQFKPVPSIEEVTFKVDLPAIMMEDATPDMTNAASMQKPEEIYQAGEWLRKNGHGVSRTRREGMVGAEGISKTEAELTKDERKQRRRAKKRAAKKQKLAKEHSKFQKSIENSNQMGIYSETDAQILKKMRKNSSDAVTKFSKSRDVFEKINAIATTTKPPSTKKNDENFASQLKL